MVADGCDEYHPETHIVTDDRCPCGHVFSGAGTRKVVSDFHNIDLPVEHQAGMGTPLERDMASTASGKS